MKGSRFQVLVYDRERKAAGTLGLNSPSPAAQDHGSDDLETRR